MSSTRTFTFLRLQDRLAVWNITGGTYKRITLTVEDDLEYDHRDDRQRWRDRVTRMRKEAFEQGVILSRHEIADIYQMSPSYISQMLKDYRKVVPHHTSKYWRKLTPAKRIEEYARYFDTTTHTLKTEPEPEPEPEPTETA